MANINKLNKIIQAVGTEYNISEIDIRRRIKNSPSKFAKADGRYVIPKQVVAYLAYVYTDSTYDELTKVLGYTSKGTIHHSINTIKTILKVDKALQERINRIINNIFQ